MSLKLHNTLTKQIDSFKSQAPSIVKLYTCGPTVYDFPHVGNWSGYIYWDILVRLLQIENYTVERVMNITDVGHLVSDADEGEDKLEKGARREGKTAWEVAAFYTKDFLNGMKQLNLIEPSHLTKATDFISEQIDLIRKLEEKGYTYTISDGVYFDTSKFPTYADFAHLDLASLRAGARVEFNQEKRTPSDFALWKFTPKNQKRDMEWTSPWGKGFPGWHLECSTMAMSILGETLDIHTGGIDHIPVHHTNEIAQSEGASGKIFSHFWLHNDHLKVNGTKISKSLGNGFTLQDLAAKGFSPEDFRLFILQSHYRSEGNFTWENLVAAQNRLLKWKNVAELRWQTSDGAAESFHYEQHQQKLVAALDDDLNTPEALKVIDEAFDSIKDPSVLNRDSLTVFLQYIDQLLGLRLIDTTPDVDLQVKDLLIQREQARKQKDWLESDRLREDLETRGIFVKDSENITTWYRQATML